MIIMGFDASTTTIGMAVLEVNNSKITLKHLEHYKPPKVGHVVERLAKTRSYIQDQLKKYNPDEVVIEDILLGLSHGKTTIKTLSSLAVLNRVVCLAAYDHLGKLPHLLSVMKVRHAIKQNKIFPKKEDVPELVASRLGIPFPYVYNKKGKISAENYDRADSIAVALAYHLLEQ